MHSHETIDGLLLPQNYCVLKLNTIVQKNTRLTF